MIVKIIYKIFRSIIFSVTLFVVGLYVITYTLLSIPAFTNKVKDLATEQISNFLGGTVIIGEFNIFPFNEVKITDLEVVDPEGQPCLKVQTIGAGISLWKLLTEARIELTFGEIIGLDANIVQEEKDGPLNIDFIINAFSPKKDNQEKKAFELALKNVVLRKSRLSFKREWLKDENTGFLNLSQIEISDLAADISFPKISDKGVEVDLRRLSFSVQDILNVQKLGLLGEFNPEGIKVNNFVLELPQSRLFIPEIYLPLKENTSFTDLLSRGDHHLSIIDSYLTPSDFAFLYEPLENFTLPLNIDLQAHGNLSYFSIENVYFGNSDVLSINFKADARNLNDLGNISGDISDFNFFIQENTLVKLADLSIITSPQVKTLLRHSGNVEITADVSADIATKAFKGNLDLISEAYKVAAEGEYQQIGNQHYKGQGEINFENIHLHHLFPATPISNLNGNLTADVELKGFDTNGELHLAIDDFTLKGKKYEGIDLKLNADQGFLIGDLSIHNEIADLDGIISARMPSLYADNTKKNKSFDAFKNFKTEMKEANLELDLQRLDLSEIIDMKTYEGYLISGEIKVGVQGEDLNDFTGFLDMENFSFDSPDGIKNLNLHHLNIDLSPDSDNDRVLNLKSDWIELHAQGSFNFPQLEHQVKTLLEGVAPAFISSVPKKFEKFDTSNIDFDIVVKKNNSIPEFFKLPFRFLVPINISGALRGDSNTASLTIDVPYLQQGKDKLIYDSRFVADIDGDSGVLNALITTTMPVKKGDLALNVSLFAKENELSTDLHFINTENPDFKGHLVLDTEFSRNPISLKPDINLTIMPSVLQMGTAQWNIGRANIRYSDKAVAVEGLRLWNDNQRVEVGGIASPLFSDAVNVSLTNIDVDYVFDMLQINYVTFGGVASGEVTGRALLSGEPVAETEGILIKEFTYNGCRFGECLATSRWNNTAKEIEINADISDNGTRLVKAGGGIWLGRDSLSFDIDATKVPVDFVQPFMEVFSSHVGGFATGDVKLFGTFHDIDMTGKIFADSVAVKLDYTNTIYHGSDSVFLTPGKIEIPNFRLYDKFGNSALLTGELTHRYFHDPSFTFRLSDASNFLCYDTNKDINPDWYGTLYGSGSALLKGVPGLTDISADMTVSGNSVFTFVLNDTQYAQDYQFLTFSDRRKEAIPKPEPDVEDFKAMLKKRMHADEGPPSHFGIDIRASVTPQVLFTLVMDPIAGDKITARGQGAMQMKYESDNDELMMYGKYEINEGNYNFSLQDIILRDFKIKEGSYISFNGNPLAADLDISATYRVNTNLSDLDKSFSTDRDLNRTNVPVDAVLSVNGNMQQPDISFDIELPTLTQDVERKVKSIISTDDMMNRQIIYLLALNRFYTPEYMGNSGNGGELAAVASSTISTQLSNILGQLTDKFSVSPSFRSDKGDFSDIEVDVALSSRLLNNRLLINGNFGYRDRSNSSTTFVGDFDVEYLLSKNGNLRLKAYNHFNDQNYYLREALTTQGLGVVYRRDFDNWFTFLKKRTPAMGSEATENPEIEQTEIEEVREHPTEKITENKEDGTQF